MTQREPASSRSPSVDLDARPTPLAGPRAGEPWPEVGEAWLVYDGDCPFCTRYTHYLRLRQAVGEVRLIDAREGGEVVAMLDRRQVNLDEGMVLILGERCYHGADCLHALALLSSPVDWFNRLNHALFRRSALARTAYPLLRGGRNLVLRLMGRRPIKGS